MILSRSLPIRRDAIRNMTPDIALAIVLTASAHRKPCAELIDWENISLSVPIVIGPAPKPIRLIIISAIAMIVARLFGWATRANAAKFGAPQATFTIVEGTYSKSAKTREVEKRTDTNNGITRREDAAATSM